MLVLRVVRRVLSVGGMALLLAAAVAVLGTPGGLAAQGDGTPPPAAVSLPVITSFETGNPDQRRHDGSLAWSPDGTLLAVARDHRLHVYDTTTFAERLSLDIEQDEPRLVWHPDGDMLASPNTLFPTITLWDVTASDQQLELRSRELQLLGGDGEALGDSFTRVVDLAFSPDGTRLAAALCAGRCGPAGVFDLRTGRLLQSFEGTDPDGQPPFLLGSANLVKWSPDGAWLATGVGVDLWMGSIVWDVATGRDIFRLPGYVPYPASAQIARGSPGALAWGADGDLLALSGHETTRIWHLDRAGSSGAAAIVAEVSGEAAAFSPDGGQLATSLLTVSIWSTDGVRLASAEAGTGPLLEFAYSPDGTMLAGLNTGGTVTIWDTSRVTG